MPDGAAGKIKSCDATQAVLDQIEKHDPTVGAYLSTFGKEALEKAKQIDKKIAAGEPVGSLAGVPIAIKDNMSMSTGTTTCGSKILENFNSVYDAHVVELLQGADAVLIGKCNMDEFAMGSST
ncbi:MAG TPA: Asp-tRNA(Asn)/Glu-tRNA(Gln) amidotransferase GatCAB subunit A, partial [Phycisphaerales bacterium]|nr:Asp-tRNA(Asn)/Glu-tRNA(Gln) amidotransferase GatCAB subunit A [Phycisphaerales bacterium]